MLDLLAKGSGYFPAVVVAAGLLASFHCAGMCGPLIVAVSRTRQQLTVYHLSRLLAYTGAGALAGGLAASVQNLAPAWLVWAVMISMALLLMMVGVARLMGHTLHARVPAFVNRAQKRALALRSQGPNLAAALVGGLSVFLPCGHLYAFLAGAAATGSAVKGATLMALFAFSTWPILFTGLSFFQRWLSFSQRFRVSGVLFVAAGLMSLASFAIAFGTSRESAKPAAAELHCH